MKLDIFTEVLWAATMTNKVKSRFESRGGIFLVAPPGQMKTSMLAIFEDQPGVLAYSDMTTINIVEARDYIAAHKASTLILYDLQKLFERRADTAANIIGNLRSIMDEGFTSASFERASHNLIQQRARALVMAALTPTLYRKRLSEWEDSGLARRVIFCVFRLKNPEAIENAIMADTPIDIKTSQVSFPSNLEIVTGHKDTDDAFLKHCLGKQLEDVPLVLMKKILAVLRWKYTVRLKTKDISYDILKEFSKCMKGSGAEIEL